MSVSLGSSKRNHTVVTRLLGEDFKIERIGTDGDLAQAGSMIRNLDGKVDAIGLGGIDRYIYAGEKRYEFRDASKLAKMAQKTPVVDGSGLKDSLERRVVKRLVEHGGFNMKGRKVLMVAAVDRFGMAEELANAECDMVFGDLMFALGLPVPIRSLHVLRRIAYVVAPIVTLLPFKILYPTGEKQDGHNGESKYARYYDWADVIAGDFHFIRRHMPTVLQGKVFLTNTVTSKDVEELRARGAARLITTTPELEGRSFGTNVIEACLVALRDSRDALAPDTYLQLLDEIGFEPRIEVFHKEESRV